MIFKLLVQLDLVNIPALFLHHPNIFINSLDELEAGEGWSRIDIQTNVVAEFEDFLDVCFVKGYLILLFL
jgi:hypothetical protein